MRKFIWLCALLFLPTLAYGQGIPFAVNPPAPNSQITVCSVPANGNPCTNQITIYSNVGLTTPITQPVQIGQTGNYTFFYASSSGVIDVQITGRADQIVGGGGGGSSSPIDGPPTRGLLGLYLFPSTDSAGSVTDSSGNGNTGTGTTGTAPTIDTAANGGGLLCNGAGNIKLPAALNGALSVDAYVTVEPPLVTQDQALWLGNGNLSTTNASGLLLNWNNSSPPGDKSNIYVGGYTNNALTGTSWPSFFGTNSIALTMDSTAGKDRLWFNGQEVSYHTQTGLSAGNQSAGFYQVCGNAAGSGATLATYSQSGTKIWVIAFYSVVQNQAELGQFSSWAALAGATRNGAQTYITTPTPVNQIYAQATSITAGNGLTPYTSQMFLNMPTPTVINRGIAGQTCATIQSLPPFQSDIYYIPTAQKNINILECGTNDCALSVSTTTIEQQVEAAARDRYSRLGQKIFIATEPDRGSFSTCVEAVSQLERANWRATGAVGLIDWMSDARLGANTVMSGGACDSGDHIHPTQSCIDNDETPLAQKALNRFTGNTDFSTANTYTTTAVAAVATTAGSEVTNTVTITTAGTPANCLAGSVVLVTGVTPAGYNSPAGTGWFILTRDTTHITYWADTGSMGAVSIQGTIQCPSQVDADNYFILGGSASTPNFILQPCEGRTGQSDYAQITNTTSPWTITPFSGEQINGGSSFTAPTATANNHQVVRLTPVLTSSTAGGCSWQASVQ